MSTKTFDNQTCSLERRAFLKSTNNPLAPPLRLNGFTTIGRGADNTLRLEDPYVSHRHCRIQKKNDRYYITDLKSRNGTILNGSSIVEAQLKELDRISLGKQRFIFSHSYCEQKEDSCLTSKSPHWKKQLSRLEAISTSAFPVLITGPSGCGKEVLAQQIHRLSNRENHILVSVNCSALSESLIESELFGHLKGSFTGAHCDRKGAFEQARGGTLFLDEIGDLPPSLQPKLLRALEACEIRPVGSDRNIKTDVRIIAATHKDLMKSVKEGEFREDLFYRLNVINFSIPALKHRKEDLPDLISSFAKKYKVKFKMDSILALQEYNWPGNIRELKNLVAKCSVYFGSDEVTETDVKKFFVEAEEAPLEISNQSKIKIIEKEMIIRTLQVFEGNQRKAAEHLGMPKSTLNDKIRAYRIDLKKMKALA